MFWVGLCIITNKYVSPQHLYKLLEPYGSSNIECTTVQINTVPIPGLTVS